MARLLALVVSAIVTCATGASAAVTAFTSQAEFLAAAGTVSRIEMSHGYYDFNPVDLGPLSVHRVTQRSADGSYFDERGLAEAFPYHLPEDPYTIHSYAALDIFPDYDLVIGFETPARAFGIDMLSPFNPAGLFSFATETRVLVDGVEIAAPGKAGSSFLGFISDAPMSEMRFVTATADSVDIYSVFHGTEGLSPVPLPATAWLLAAAIGLTAARARRGGAPVA